MTDSNQAATFHRGLIGTMASDPPRALHARSAVLNELCFKYEPGIDLLLVPRHI